MKAFVGATLCTAVLLSLVDRRRKLPTLIIEHVTLIDPDESVERTNMTLVVALSVIKKQHKVTAPVGEPSPSPANALRYE